MVTNTPGDMFIFISRTHIHRQKKTTHKIEQFVYRDHEEISENICYKDTNTNKKKITPPAKQYSNNINRNTIQQ